MSSNKEAYESEELVAYYRSYDRLQKPEETILGLLQPALESGRVLDIGVGGGRTTKFLSAAAREYVGIDYSTKMVDACREKFRGTQNVQFLVCDARDMRMFVDDFFDIVVFAFNGLDSVAHDDRLHVLREVRRVLKSEGWFVFSSHNLRYATRYFSIWPPLWPPWKWVLAPLRNAKRRALNPKWSELLNREYAILNDGAHGWRLSNYYIDPSYQVEQLRGTDFTNVRFFSLTNGAEISSVQQLENSRDPWLYFLCKAKK